MVTQRVALRPSLRRHGRPMRSVLPLFWLSRTGARAKPGFGLGKPNESLTEQAKVALPNAGRPSA